MKWRAFLQHGLQGYDDRTRRYAIDYLFQGLPQIVVNILLMPLVIGAVFWKGAPAFWLGLWLLAALLVSLARLWLANQYRNLIQPHDQHYRWIRYFTLTSLCSGIVWGCAGFAFAASGGLAEQVILFVSIIGLAAGCIIITCYWLPSYFAYAIPSVGLTAIYLLWQPSLAFRALGLLVLMYLGVISRVAVNQSRHAYQAIQLRFENIELIEQLTEQKKLAEKADADKSRFLAAASHDLRQPLQAMQLYLSSLHPDQSLRKQPEVWAGMQKSMASLQSLFSSLLDLSRLDAGMLQPSMREFSLQAMLAGFIGEYQDQATQKGLQLIMPDNDVIVRSDPVLLENIVRNLLSNALRYSREGEVKLSWSVRECTQGASRVVFQVSDTGLGIPEHLLSEIFNEYFQVGNPERDKNNGLGLGLAIVRRLTRLLGCDIAVESVLGKGSLFALYIPAGTRAESLFDNQALPESAVEFSGRQVWVVDDEQIVREAMSHLLRKWGCIVHVFSDPNEVLEFSRMVTSIPDLIISDYRLRGPENGAQLLLRLQQQLAAGFSGLIITGDTSPERLREAKSYNLPLMYKPIQELRLRIFLRQVFAEKM